MTFSALPASAAWSHRDSRSGFEVAFFDREDAGYRLAGSTAAVDEGEAWCVAYEIVVDDEWVTRRATIENRTVRGGRSVLLEHDGEGRWTVDGVPAPGLDGCYDVDLESSAMTNTFPVHRLPLAPAARAQAPAVPVRADDLSVERLEQSYERLAGRTHRYDYLSPSFDFRCELVYDDRGLVLEYPGIASRAL